MSETGYDIESEEKKMARIKRYCGNYILECDGGRLKEYCGSYRYEIEGFMTRKEIMMLLTLLYA